MCCAGPLEIATAFGPKCVTIRDRRYRRDTYGCIRRLMRRGSLTIVRRRPVAKCQIVIETQSHGSRAMTFVARLLFAVIGLTSVLPRMSDGSEPKQTNARSAKANRAETKPVRLVVRSKADIKQTFTYSPYPAVPDELEGYAGSQVGGTGTYRLMIDSQGAVTQVTILKGFTVTAVYDERFSNIKGNAVPALDQVMVQALMRWRARPGPMRVVDIYWSFGTQPWVNYGKPGPAK